MKKAFSLVEILIVVVILGVLAGIVMTQLAGATSDARSASAKTILETMRKQIEMYALQHSGIAPGYPNGDTTAAPSPMTFVWQMTYGSKRTGEYASPGTAGYPFGPYLRTFPKNPFNDEWGITMIANNGSFPAAATGNLGWIYKPATREIRLDWAGADEEGVRYYDY